MQMHENNITEQEALYELPEGWKWTRLGDCSSVISKGTTPKGGKDAYLKEGVNFLRIENLNENGSINLSNISHISIEEHEGNLKRSILEEGDLLISIAGTLGKVGFITKADLPMNTNQAIAFVRLHKDIFDNKYLKYAIENPFVNAELLAKTKVTSIPNLTLEIISNCLIPLPPTLAEQQRIVNRIETIFAKLDEAKEKAQNVVDSFETRKAAILHKAFTGELTANWRKENGISDDSWEEKRLEDVCDFITKGTTPKKEDMSIGNGDIPYIKVYNLCFDTKLDFTIDPTFVKLESHKNFLARSITLPGDVLMNIVGPPFGKVSIVPDSYPEWNINQAIARFRCKSELYNVYLANYLISPKTIENMSRQIKTTAGQQNLTLEICRSMTILVPSLPEQQEIVRILDIVLEKESRAKEAAQTVLNQIALLKKSILARAFRGEL